MRTPKVKIPLLNIFIIRKKSTANTTLKNIALFFGGGGELCLKKRNMTHAGSTTKHRIRQPGVQVGLVREIREEDQPSQSLDEHETRP